MEIGCSRLWAVHCQGCIRAATKETSYQRAVQSMTSYTSLYDADLLQNLNLFCANPHGANKQKKKSTTAQILFC